MTDHYGLPVCCMTCDPPQRCEPITVGRPEQINGAGWDTTTVVACPTCAREFVVIVQMRPTHNPAATPGKRDYRQRLKEPAA